MIEIIRGCDRADPLTISMLEERKTLFVDLLGWDVPVVEGRYEIDAYDEAAATYVVATDEDRNHLGSLRLLGTEGGHLLADRFATLCDNELPYGPHVLEITRLCLPQRHGAGGRLRVRNRLISAMVDHCLEMGVSVLTGVVTAAYREQVLAMGWRASPLGPVRAHCGSALGAFRLDVDADTLARLAANGIYMPGTRAVAELA